jgi:hypothetical protein
MEPGPEPSSELVEERGDELEVVSQDEDLLLREVETRGSLWSW